jgi:hypothetical protein
MEKNDVRKKEKNMKPDKVIRKGGKGCIIIASFGTFFHWC